MRTPVAFSLAATVLTALLGLAHLARATFRITECFQTGTMSGCSTHSTDFAGVMIGTPLHLAIPLGALALVTGLAGGAWAMARSGDTLSHAGCVAAYAIVTGPVSLIIGPVYVVPLLLLVAGVLLICGATETTVVRELAKGMVIVVGAFAATLAAIALWGARFGGLPGTAASVWLYVGIATALGIAAGCVAAVERREPRALVRWLVVSHAGFGFGLLATAVALMPSLYPHGHYVNLGISGVWRAAATALVTVAVAGVLALRIFGRLSWLASAAATGVIAGLFFGSTLGTLGLAWDHAGAIEPPVPLLPNTSTRP